MVCVSPLHSNRRQDKVETLLDCVFTVHVGRMESAKIDGPETERICIYSENIVGYKMLEQARKSYKI